MSLRLEGWRQIADQIGRSEKWCRTLATRADDPLPVNLFGGIVIADAETVATWVKRQEGKPYVRRVRGLRNERDKCGQTR